MKKLLATLAIAALAVMTYPVMADDSDSLRLRQQRPKRPGLHRSRRRLGNTGGNMGNMGGMDSGGDSSSSGSSSDAPVQDPSSEPAGQDEGSSGE